METVFHVWKWDERNVEMKWKIKKNYHNVGTAPNMWSNATSWSKTIQYIYYLNY